MTSQIGVARSWRILFLSVAACSSASGTAQAVDAGAGSEAEAGAASDAGTDGGGSPKCMAAGPCMVTSGTGTECVSVVTARLLQPDSSGAAGVPVFICGTNICSSPVHTGADGTATLDICLQIAKPALKVFDDPTWVPFAALLEGMGPSFDETVALTALPAAGSTLAPGTNTSGQVTLAVPGAVTFDLEHASADSRAFRAAQVGPSGVAQTLAGALPLGALAEIWGLAPLNAKLSRAGKLTVPNSNPTAWPAGTALRVWLDGTDVTGNPPPAPWGAWGFIGTAHVSADAASIVTDDGSGLPELAMVAFTP